ncbi:hypothetical protein [Mycolicibacterium sp.]|uniref:hypothetical protein n=1 Tax=Mycolicibacterium sp. TaxID=2320850 RepID=UPI00355F382D
MRLWNQPGGKALALAIVALILTAYFALWNINNRDGIVCGSWLAPTDTHTARADAEANSEASRRGLRSALLESGGDLDTARMRNYRQSTQADACEDARDARTPAVVLSGAAVVVLFAVGMVQRQRPRTDA